MDGRFLFPVALGIALAFALQTSLAGFGIALGAFRHAAAPHPARVIGFRLGARALFGAAVPVFAASWLVVHRMRPVTPSDGIWIGIGIAAGFLTLVAISETAGRASWFGAVVHAFRRSLAHFSTPALPHAPIPVDPASQAKAEAEVREAFRARRPAESLREVLRAYLERLTAKGADRFEIDREANAFYDDEALREFARRGDLLPLERGRFREMAASRADLTAEEVAQWTEALHTRWDALREEGPGREAAESASTVTGVLPEPASAQAAAAPSPGATAGALQAEGKPESATAVEAGWRERLDGFKDFLRSADRSALNPDRLEREVAALVLRQENGRESFDKEARGLRRDEVAKVLKQRRDISSREADSIADLIDSARTRMLSRSEIREHRRQEATDQAMARLRDRLYAVARPERDYGAFQRAIDRLLEERLSTSTSLETELKEFDRAGLQSLFYSKQGISKADADKMADAADVAFRNAEETARRLKAEIHRRRDETLLAAEAADASARSLASSSARWVAGISVVGAGAAALGGWLGARV